MNIDTDLQWGFTTGVKRLFLMNMVNMLKLKSEILKVMIYQIKNITIQESG